MSATKTNNIPPMLAANFTPSSVPFAIASKGLLPTSCFETLVFFSIASVCGKRILAITMAPGAAITDAASKCLAKAKRSPGSSPPKNPIYAANTPPATVAMPPTITKSISERFILGK